MRKRVIRLARWLALLAGTWSFCALAQDDAATYPNRPLRIVIGTPPGAAADTVARMTAEILSDHLKRNVIVESRPGGGGVIASTYAAKAQPDGYTLYQNGFGILIQGATKRVPFEPLDAFAPVARTTQQPYILMVHPGNPSTSVQALIAMSKTKPLAYAGASGVGSTVHIGMEKLARLSGMRLKHIAYKGGSDSNRALMAGEIDIACAAAISAVAMARSGKARALASLGSERIAAFSDLPTLAEQGYPDFEISNSYVLWVPKGTPAPIIEKVNKAATAGLNTPKYRKRLEDLGSTPLKPMIAQQVRATIERDYAEIKQSVRELDIKF